ncbi:MAG: hypothetical protein NW241_09590 [Bacteroidia bacterium]|nr:hypothetical protein [Bacteroidia bacterium]
MTKYLPLLIATLLSITFVYILPLPLDFIAKGLVVLAIFAGVLGVARWIERRNEGSGSSGSGA